MRGCTDLLELFVYFVKMTVSVLFAVECCYYIGSLYHLGGKSGYFTAVFCLLYVIFVRVLCYKRSDKKRKGSQHHNCERDIPVYREHKYKRTEYCHNAGEYLGKAL